MPDQYSITMPGAVYSGRGALRKIREITEGRFKKAALSTDQGVEQAGLLKIPLEILNEAGVETVVITDLPAEPNCDEAEQVMERFRRTGADLIVAAGGGSVMDVAKLASITADGSLTVRQLLEDPGLGRKCVPTLMIPTTAGTGSEATMNSIDPGLRDSGWQPFKESSQEDRSSYGSRRNGARGGMLYFE